MLRALKQNSLMGFVRYLHSTKLIQRKGVLFELVLATSAEFYFRKKFDSSRCQKEERNLNLKQNDSHQKG